MKPIAIQIALANTHGTVSPEEVYRFIEGQDGDFTAYQRRPPAPGVVEGAAVDYALVLGVTGSVASLASLLWRAYDKFIAPKKSDKDSAGIVIILQRDDGTSSQFWIGNMQKGQDMFMKEFSKTLEAVRSSDREGNSTERLVAKLQQRELWIRRK
jgi:hypothetical protein